MTMDTPDTTSPTRIVSLRRSVGDGSYGKFANANSYLKSRRSAATQVRRNEILGMLDSSLDDDNYELPSIPSDHIFVSMSESMHNKEKERGKGQQTRPTFHGRSNPSIRSPQSVSSETKKASRDGIASTVQDSPVLLGSDHGTPMEDILRSLHYSSWNENETTSCTDMMSSGSLGFNFSSQHTSSFASLLGDEDCSCLPNQTVDNRFEKSDESADPAPNTVGEYWDEAKTENNSSFREDSQWKNGVPGIGVDNCIDEMDENIEVGSEFGICDISLEDRSITEVDQFEASATANDGESESSASYYEEELLSDEDETVEEITLSDDEWSVEDVNSLHDLTISDAQDDDGSYYEEIVIDDDESCLYIEREYSLDEIIIEEEVLDGSPFNFEEYIQGGTSNFEASLGMIVEEVEYDSDCSEACETAVGQMLESGYDSTLIYGVPSEEAVGEVLPKDGEASINSTAEETWDESVEEDEMLQWDETSYFEEEIIPQFEVPCVPAIVAWQQREELRAFAEGNETPEVAPQTPREILIAVLSAASVDFKLRKVPEEHKRRYEPMASTAACLGRLTQLPEFSVETIGSAPTVTLDDWSPKGAPIILQRSLNLRLVNEAAAMGRLMRLKEEVVTNHDNTSQFLGDYKSKVDVDDLLDEKGRPVFRTSILVPQHEVDSRQQSMGKDWNLGILEASAEAEEMSLRDIKLPTDRIPRFNKPPACSPVMSPQEIKDAIARGVAEGAWNRKYRLERPQVELRITSACRCQYCENPNPFQTHAYKELSRRAC